MINSITRAQIQVFGSNAQNTSVHESSTRVVIILLCEFAFFFFFAFLQPASYNCALNMSPQIHFAVRCILSGGGAGKCVPIVNTNGTLSNHGFTQKQEFNQLRWNTSRCVETHTHTRARAMRSVSQTCCRIVSIWIRYVLLISRSSDTCFFFSFIFFWVF